MPQPFNLCPWLSKNFTPNAESMPVPASLVALPPIPTKNLRHPLFNASKIISPVPYVEVIQGFCSSGSNSGRPLAEDISITAVFTPFKLTTPYSASIGLPKGSVTAVVYRTPPKDLIMASTVPSPPSATFVLITLHCGKTFLIPISTALATSIEVNEPLNESDATIIFFMSFMLFCVYSI